MKVFVNRKVEPKIGDKKWVKTFALIPKKFEYEDDSTKDVWLWLEFYHKEYEYYKHHNKWIPIGNNRFKESK